MRLSLDGGNFTYAAGQAAFIGMAGQPERVPYSIASSPGETQRFGQIEFLLKLEPDGWGPHLEGLRRGAAVAIRGPVGTFTFPAAPRERQFLFVAGGTGIAPLRSMIRHALDVGQAGRLHLLYSARTPWDFAYLPELRRYARAGHLRLVATATRENQGRWRGEHGRITSERLARLIETPETLCFVCGPAPMVDAVPRMLMALGIARPRIRLEEW